MSAMSLSLRRGRYDALSLSGRYLFFGLLLGFVRIIWLVGESSGLFGRPPDAWIGDVSLRLGQVMLIYTLLGALSLKEMFDRYQRQLNEPITPLLLNVVGVVLMLLLTERVAYVTATEPRTIQTWLSNLVNGTIRGGVYALIALGYTLVYGILFMINFAHGEVMMLGAYAGYFAMMFIVDGGQQSFEAGAAGLAIFFIPVIIGLLFLPLETLFNGYNERHKTNFQTPTWLFTFFSLPVRFVLGVAIGYGALVGLGGYAPHVYLLVITIVGVLFAIACGMLASMLVSVVLERVAYRPLRNAPRLVPLISAIGASIFLQQVALQVFGPNRKAYPSPQLLNNPPNFQVSLGELGEVNISIVGAAIVVISMLLMVLLYIIVQRTKIGKAMRAVAEDKKTAALMGIDVDRVIVFTFMLGAALAGAAGVMLGFWNQQPDYRFGFSNGLKAFTAAVVGGIGNIPGAVFGGFFLGIVENLGPLLLGFDFKWQNVIAFGLLVLVLIFRPKGILGERAQVKKV